MPDEQDEPQVTKPQIARPFDSLPQEVRDWLQSETADKIIDELNEKFKLSDTQQNGIPFALTWMLIGRVPPQEFIASLIKRFAIEPKIAGQIAESVKDRLLHSVRGPLKERCGINIDLITMPPAGSQPAAQTTTLAKPLVADIKKPTAPSQAMPVRVNSQMTAMAQTTRLSQGIGSEPNKNTMTAKPIVAQPKPPAQHADNLTLQKPISFIEVQPLPPAPDQAAVAVPKPQPAPAAPTPPITPREAPAPIQSAPVTHITPSKPVEHEVEEYEDHHPVVE
jgi:hypothetical protein